MVRKRVVRENNIRYSLLVSACLVLLCTMMASPCFAAKSKAKGNDKVKSVAQAEAESKSLALAKLLEQDFTYLRENRTDPFKPFLSVQKIGKQGGGEVEELSGMQVFEPGQLNLVAILFSGSKPIAMVQDSTGKGYIVSEGTKIGRHGIIDDIQPNVVSIKEWYLNTAGNKRYKNISMVLRKEGEK